MEGGTGLTPADWVETVERTARRYRWRVSRSPVVGLDDLTQSGCLAALEAARAGSLDLADPIAVSDAAWRAMHAMARREKRRQAWIVDFRPDPPAREPDATVVIDVAEAVAALKPKLGRAVVGRWWQGRDYAEMAASDGVGVGAICERIKPAYRRLRADLAAYEPERPPLPPRYGWKTAQFHPRTRIRKRKAKRP